MRTRIIKHTHTHTHFSVINVNEVCEFTLCNVFNYRANGFSEFIR